MENFEQLTNYIKGWKECKSPKPRNEKEFIVLFIDFLKSCNSDIHFEDRDIEFCGNGAYFGKQVRFIKNYTYTAGDYYLSFEIAYNRNHIRVYTANHNGFWTPEYLDLIEGDLYFKKLRKELFQLLNFTFGLNK